MSVSSTVRGKNKLKIKSTKTKHAPSNKPEARSTNDHAKNLDAPVPNNTHRNSDAEKSLSNAPGEPYVHECREFAGVTVIIRTLNNPKALGNFDGYGKGGMHGSRRKSEFLHSQLNAQEKSEYGDRNDYSGASASNSSTKTENSANNPHETAGNDH